MNFMKRLYLQFMTFPVELGIYQKVRMSDYVKVLEVRLGLANALTELSFRRAKRTF